MGTLEVRLEKVPIAAVVVLGLIFLPMSFGLIYRGISKGFSVTPLVIGTVSLVLFAVVFWITFRGYRKSVRRFTETGLELRSGRRLVWPDLMRAVHQLHYHRRLQMLIRWRTELYFRDGDVAWLIPSKISNWSEVDAYVAKLPCPQENVKV